jgi:hypothetical protein
MCENHENNYITAENNTTINLNKNNNALVGNKKIKPLLIKSWMARKKRLDRQRKRI